LTLFPRVLIALFVAAWRILESQAFVNFVTFCKKKSVFVAFAIFC
jgi:hypothetical protein